MTMILNINQYFINKFYFQPSVHEWAELKSHEAQFIDLHVVF